MPSNLPCLPILQGRTALTLTPAPLNKLGIDNHPRITSKRLHMAILVDFNQLDCSRLPPLDLRISCNLQPPPLKYLPYIFPNGSLQLCPSQLHLFTQCRTLSTIEYYRQFDPFPDHHQPHGRRHQQSVRQWRVQQHYVFTFYFYHYFRIQTCPWSPFVFFGLFHDADDQLQ